MLPFKKNESKKELRDKLDIQIKNNAVLNKKNISISQENIQYQYDLLAKDKELLEKDKEMFNLKVQVHDLEGFRKQDKEAIEELESQRATLRRSNKKMEEEIEKLKQPPILTIKGVAMTKEQADRFIDEQQNFVPFSDSKIEPLIEIADEGLHIKEMKKKTRTIGNLKVTPSKDGRSTFITTIDKPKKEKSKKEKVGA